MTRDRDLKQKVRARMEKTGERYAAARAALVPAEEASAPVAPTSWRTLVGAHPETTAVVRIAAAAGVRVSEAMVLGLGGGLGGGYFVFDYKGLPPTFYVATRCHPQYAYDVSFVRTAVTRLGLAIDTHETTSKPTALKQLRARVAEAPVIAWLDRNALAWSGALPGMMGAMPHVVVIGELDGDAALAHDLGAAPYRVPLADLAKARGALRNAKHRLAWLRTPTASAIDPSACLDAIDSCVAELRGRAHMKAFASNFGVPAFAKWAGLLGDARDKKGWPKLFASGLALWNALTWGWFWIEGAGTGGGGFRPLYASFLDEAAALTKRPALAAAATRYRALGAAWTAIADAMLPSSSAFLADTRAALDARRRSGRAGPAGLADLSRALATLSALRKRADAELDATTGTAIRTDLLARVTALAADERAAADALAAAANRT